MADNKDEHGSEATPSRKRPSGLGRGLNALFGDVAVEAPVLATPGGAAKAAPAASGDSVQHVGVGSIRPLPGQPRRHFDENAIAELADSIGLRGLLQPIIVRRSPDGDGYQLVAGERRSRSSADLPPSPQPAAPLRPAAPTGHARDLTLVASRSCRLRLRREPRDQFACKPHISF